MDSYKHIRKERVQEGMILGSHNSWSYLPPKKWYMKPLRFTAQCQDWDIKTQYEHGVRCFDLRIKYDGNTLQVVHNIMVYKCTTDKLLEDLTWLNTHDDVWVRVLLDVRSKRNLTERQQKNFRNDCSAFEQLFPNIKFWCGRNLVYDWSDVRSSEYEFKNNPSCEEHYSSVEGCKLDDIYPRAWAKKHNKSVYAKGTDKQIFLIDFVNYIA